MKIIKSVIAQDEAITAGAVKTYDLPTNPLSFITFAFKCLNVTDEATEAEILARLSKIEVLYQGQSILSLSGVDLHALQSVLFGSPPQLTNRITTDNATRTMIFILPLGRTLYNPEECFPATLKGQLQLQITLSSTETACDGVIYQIETTELLGATPKRHLKVTTLAKTPTATGEVDVDLPVGNELAGILLWATTVPTAIAWTATIEYVKLMVDNVEVDYAKMNWETLNGELTLRCPRATEIALLAGDDVLNNHGFLDLSPANRDDMLIATAGLSSVKLRAYAGDTNPLRILPVELVTR